MKLEKMGSCNDINKIKKSDLKTNTYNFNRFHKTSYPSREEDRPKGL